MKLIEKSALVAEIESYIRSLEACLSGKFPMEASVNVTEKSKGKLAAYKRVISFIDTLEVKEVDLNALGILAKHLIACDAHGITPKYIDRELDLLEGLANNKAQKGEEV